MGLHLCAYGLYLWKNNIFINVNLKYLFCTYVQRLRICCTDVQRMIRCKQLKEIHIKTAKKYKIYIEEPVLDEINKENSQKIVENIEYLVKKIRQKQLEKEGEILKKGQKIIQDLNWFEKSFGRYVENQTYEAKDMDEKLNEIFQLKKRGLRNIKIINFNYTSKVRKGLSDLMKSMIVSIII